MRKVGPRQEEWAPSRAALISTIIFILCWLNHLDVVVLKSCVFCLFKQILPLWSLCISLALSGVSAYSKCSIFIRIVVKILIFISSYHSSSGGKKTSALLWTPAAHMVTVRTNIKNMPPFWTSNSGQVCQMPFQRFFALKLRGEINSLGAELVRCEPMNSSRQRWFLGEKVRYGEENFYSEKGKTRTRKLAKYLVSAKLFHNSTFRLF